MNDREALEAYLAGMPIDLGELGAAWMADAILSWMAVRGYCKLEGRLRVETPDDHIPLVPLQQMPLQQMPRPDRVSYPTPGALPPYCSGPYLPDGGGEP